MAIDTLWGYIFKNRKQSDNIISGIRRTYTLDLCAKHTLQPEEDICTLVF